MWGKVSNHAGSPAISFSSLELISPLMTLPSDASQGIIKGPWNKKGNIAITGTFIGKKEIKNPRCCISTPRSKPRSVSLLNVYSSTSLRCYSSSSSSSFHHLHSFFPQCMIIESNVLCITNHMIKACGASNACRFQNAVHVQEKSLPF